MAFQQLFAAIWAQDGGPAFQARHGLSSSQYQQTFDQLTSQGFRLRRVAGYSVNGQELYAAIWEQDGGPPFQARHGLTASQYQQAFNEITAQGFRLTCVSGYNVNNQDRYAAIWEQAGGPPLEARHGLTASQYQQTFDQLTGQGFRLRRVSGYSLNGQDHYAAIWVQDGGPPFQARHGLTAAQYQQAFNDFTAQGFRLTCVNAFNAINQDHFAAIWEQNGGIPFQARHNLTAAQYQQTFDQLTSQGFRLRDVIGYEGNV